MSLFKVPILFAVMIHVWRAVTPPSRTPLPTTVDSKTKLQSGGMERYSRHVRYFLAFVHKLSACIPCILEMVLLIALYAPKSPLSHRIISALTTRQSSPSDVRITPQFLIGAALVIGGSQLRSACYRALGNLFSFELVLFEEHKLVKTGPYAYIRHPSYLGMVCVNVGCLLLLFGRGSWCWETAWPVGRILLGISLPAWCAILVDGLILRPVVEDRYLRERFGKEWDMWAKSTPYRVIPFVY
ncbi:hypothetical protein BV25DRAFT_1916028 [Artomyces pyxidatus]|uniref:Uncharacterized protein n=1 Tax=Artomyces pyxidatus TaxID=48021 RepID=A0ACB8T104_9AGAM|nr:hypothetical protein BV25DRAFT_1916028 [Artomyces pyxidatus]